MQFSLQSLPPSLSLSAPKNSPSCYHAALHLYISSLPSHDMGGRGGMCCVVRVLAEAIDRDVGD